MTFLVLAATAAIIVGCVTLFVRNYCRSCEGSIWCKLLDTASNSATILWSYIVAAGGAVLAWSASAADVLNMPEVRTAIEGSFKAEYVGAAMTVIALVTILARLRTLARG